MNELWKDIPGFEGKYQASTLGRIKSLTRQTKFKTRWGTTAKRTHIGQILKTDRKLIGHGYMSVALGSQGEGLVHRFIALTFVNNPNGFPCVNHKNGNKLDNRACNLEWITHQNNTIHGWKNGLMENVRKAAQSLYGENSSNAKLTDELVISIRKCHSDGAKIRQLARQYGLGKTTIASVVYRKTWKHI